MFYRSDKYEYLLPKKNGVQFVQVIKKKIQIRIKINSPRLTTMLFGVVKFAIRKLVI